MKLRRIPANRGRKYESENGRFYIGWGGDIYAFHLELGPFSFCWLSKR